MLDSEPDAISQHLTWRDRDIETDWVAVSIDSRHDHLSAYMFQISAVGVQRDALIYNDGEINADWDAVWTGAVSRDEGGWSAELAIPLANLRYAETPIPEWGFQVERNVSRKHERSVWAFVPSEVHGSVSRWGHLRGLERLASRHAFEVRAYAAGRMTSEGPTGDTLFGLGKTGHERELGADAGLDLKLGLTSELALDLTLNPDFGQVEADQVIFNLTRYETFLPEKRPFFMEGQDTFATPFNLFYSRRIGLPPVGPAIGQQLVSPAGETLTVTDTAPNLRIWTAGKVTGSATDRLSIGALGAITGSEWAVTEDGTGATRELELAPPRAHGILRARHSLGSSAYVGLTATSATRLGGEIRRADANHDAYAQAVDARWQSAGGSWRLLGQAVIAERVGGTAYQTDTGQPCESAGAGCLPIARTNGTRLAPGDVGYGGIGELHYRSEHWFLDLEYKAISPKLDINDVGFETAFDAHAVEAVGGYIDRKAPGILQNYSIKPVAVGSSSFDGVLREVGVGIDSDILFKRYVFTSPGLVVYLPGTWDDVETLDGARFERPGALDGNWVVTSNPARALVASGRVLGRLDLKGNGRFAGFIGSMSWKGLPSLEMELELETGRDENALRFYSCQPDSASACLVESGARAYVFAELDAWYASLIHRSTYVLSSTLSLQGYAQLFLSRGRYRDFREVQTSGRRPFIERADLVPSLSDGDTDGDGKVDQDFASTLLNLNLAFRWELAPGSALFLVYQRQQSARASRLQSEGPVPALDALLVKLVYFFS